MQGTFPTGSKNYKGTTRGSAYSKMQEQNHFAMTKDEPVIVEITGYGPSGVTYVNPADDPENHKN